LRSEALRWFDEATWGLDTARIPRRERRCNAAAFYAHQAAEKAVKALLYHVHEAPWGRSVRELPRRYYARTGGGFDEELLTLARELDRHYIPSRYPSAHPSGTPHEAHGEETSGRAIRAGEKIVAFAGRELGLQGA